jgi:hypothetical protein
MGTHAVIAVQYNETINAVYCHWDGYFEHVGNILQEHYKTEDKIDQLIQNGGMSSLGETIEKCGFYNETGYDVDNDFKLFVDSPFQSAREKLLTYAKASFISYVYLFVEGNWIMSKTDNFKA